MRLRYRVGLSLAAVAATALPSAAAFAQGGTQPSDTTVTASVNPAVTGQPVTFTATVTDPSDQGTPTGSVQFTITGTFSHGTPTCGTVTLVAGVATCSFPAGATLAAGDTVTASYSGDDTYAASSGSASETVDPDATTVNVAASPDPAVAKNPVFFEATVSADSPGVGIPTGTLTFSVTDSTGATLKCSGGDTTTLPDGGVCSIAALKMADGPYTVSVTYSGDDNFSTSTTSLTEAVVPQTTTKVTTSTKALTSGEPVTYTATVTPKPNKKGEPIPTGNVVFAVLTSSGKSVSCSGSNTQALSAGEATCSIPSGLSSTSSPYTITAYYQGSSAYGPSLSKVLTQSVT